VYYCAMLKCLLDLLTVELTPHHIPAAHDIL